MKIGDIVKATWTDGLELVGRYTGTEQGYIILTAEDGNRIICDANSVKFEVINKTREKK